MLTDIDPWEALEGFILDEVIDEVVGLLKAGKEAVVYLTRKAGDPPQLYAAKIYKDLTHRTFRNDAVYRAGRFITDKRTRSAVAKGTEYGREVRVHLWRQQEADVMRRLHRAGARVPRFIRAGGDAILMEYLGDEQHPAPPLNSVRLPAAEAQRLFDQVLESLDILLDEEIVHADLSAYNLLYWRGQAWLIDFPQAVDLYDNPSAIELFARDVRNVCQYFARCGVECSAWEVLERFADRLPGRVVVP